MGVSDDNGFFCMSSDQVVVLKPTVQKETIRLLEEMLAEAKTGRLQHFTAIVELSQNDFDYRTSGTNDFVRTLGALRWAQNRIERKMQESLDKEDSR